MKKISCLIAVCCFAYSSTLLANINPTDAAIVKEQEANIKQQGILVLEKEFNFKYQNDEQLQQFVTQQINNYYSKLRNCIPGSYKFVVPFVGFIVNKATIHGFKDNHCLVDSYYFMGNKKIESQCQYQKNSLAVFTEEEAAKTAKGQFSYDSQHLTPLQKVQETECKVITNGTPLT